MLGFGVLEKWRHNLVHEGILPVVSASVERYLQLMFLDLLRLELELPARHHMLLMQQASGYDLTPLGFGKTR